MKGPWPPWADRPRHNHPNLDPKTPQRPAQPQESASGFDATTPLCACGCGQPAPTAAKTSTANGVRAGQQLRYRHGPNTRPRNGATR